MANQLYNALGNRPQNDFQNMVQQFRQFRASFQGDPKKEVERLLRSGMMDQRQLDQLQEMASQFRQLLS